jgi:hypothetical protein
MAPSSTRLQHVEAMKGRSTGCMFFDDLEAIDQCRASIPPRKACWP